MENTNTRLIIEDIGDEIKFEMVGDSHEVMELITNAMLNSNNFLRTIHGALFAYLSHKSQTE